MSDTSINGFFVGLGLGILVMFAGIWSCSMERREDLRKRAIEQHAAIYSTDAGTFTWTDERVKIVVEGK